MNSWENNLKPEEIEKLRRVKSQADFASFIRKALKIGLTNHHNSELKKRGLPTIPQFVSNAPPSDLEAKIDSWIDGVIIKADTFTGGYGAAVTALVEDEYNALKKSIADYFRAKR